MRVREPARRTAPLYLGQEPLGQSLCTLTDADGHFAFERVRAGRWFVSSSATTHRTVKAAPFQLGRGEVRRRFNAPADTATA